MKDHVWRFFFADLRERINWPWKLISRAHRDKMRIYEQFGIVSLSLELGNYGNFLLSACVAKAIVDSHELSSSFLHEPEIFFIETDQKEKNRSILFICAIHENSYCFSPMTPSKIVASIWFNVNRKLQAINWRFFFGCNLLSWAKVSWRRGMMNF